MQDRDVICRPVEQQDAAQRQTVKRTHSYAVQKNCASFTVSCLDCVGAHGCHELAVGLTV